MPYEHGIGTHGRYACVSLFYYMGVIDMTDTIQIRAGAKANMPQLAVREIAYVTDEDGGALYIGTATGNKKLCTVGTIRTLENMSHHLNEMETALEGKLTASRMPVQSALDSAAETAAIVTAFNTLLEALKAAGMMARSGAGNA